MIIKGTVIFKEANIGSKSRGEYPYLLLETGDSVRITLLGDNPFENTQLREYDSKNVILEGELNENGKFIAERIEETFF